jgi:hypothetical protein
MSKGQQNRRTEKAAQNAAASAHDPVIVDLVKLLARLAAERDYARFCASNARSQSKPEARQD